jgi:hypothetical protein
MLTLVSISLLSKNIRILRLITIENLTVLLFQLVQRIYICKHVIGMDIRLTFYKPSSLAEDIPLSEKRKRERYQKAKKVLLIQ